MINHFDEPCGTGIFSYIGSCARGLYCLRGLCTYVKQNNTGGSDSVQGSTEVGIDEENRTKDALDNNGFEDLDDKNITVSWKYYDGGISLEYPSDHYSVFNLEIR